MKNFVFLLILTIFIVGIVACQPQEVEKDLDYVKVVLTEDEKEILGVNVDFAEVRIATENDIDIDSLIENDLISNAKSEGKRKILIGLCNKLISHIKENFQDIVTNKQWGIFKGFSRVVAPDGYIEYWYIVEHPDGTITLSRPSCYSDGG